MVKIWSLLGHLIDQKLNTHFLVGQYFLIAVKGSVIWTVLWWAANETADRENIWTTMDELHVSCPWFWKLLHTSPAGKRPNPPPFLPHPPPLTTLCMCASQVCVSLSVCVYVCVFIAACNMHLSWGFSCSKGLLCQFIQPVPTSSGQKPSYNPLTKKQQQNNHPV